MQWKTLRMIRTQVRTTRPSFEESCGAVRSGVTPPPPSFRHVACATQQARETEAGRGDGVPTKAEKSRVEGRHKRTCGAASDLAAFKQQTLGEELKTRRDKALAAFQTPWLVETERELHKLTRTLERSALNQERRASMEAYREVLQDELRQFHQNYGTAGCQFALEQRKRSCVALGLLKKEQRHLVTSLFHVLPTEDEVGESSRSEDHGDDSTTYEESVGQIIRKSGVVPPPRWRPRWRRIQDGVREGPGV